MGNPYLPHTTPPTVCPSSPYKRGVPRARTMAICPPPYRFSQYQNTSTTYQLVRVLARDLGSRQGIRFDILLLIIIFLAGTALSLYHLGIEQGFIEESLVCDLQNSSKILSKEEILKQLQEKIVSCKDVTFKMFGLSLTTLNIIISILITIVLTKIYLSYEKNK